jgi:5-methylcytosine-specific restriction endonuclease McrA
MGSKQILSIKGTKYYDARKASQMGLLQKGSNLVLVRRPDNPHDSNAVEVRLNGGLMLGHLPRTCAQEITEIINSGNTVNSAISNITEKLDNIDIEIIIEYEIPSKPRKSTSQDLRSYTKTKNTAVYCEKCGEEIQNKPNINVEGKIYCFRCSKTIVVEKQHSYESQVQDKYSNDLSDYFNNERSFQNKTAKWKRKFRPYEILCIALSCILFIMVSPFLNMLILKQLGSKWAGLGYLIGFILSLIIWSVLSTVLYGYYSKRNPEPHSEHALPVKPIVPQVAHYPMINNEVEIISAELREFILKRDNMICQNCGKKKRKTNLEVHHIIPRSKGGTNDINNCVTLCKYCHDREKWYGHVRAHPTTLKRKNRKIL